jgi:glycosyltransferase involved in cell wall biosynthesis
MRIAIEGQRLFRERKHGMDFVALELVKQIMLLDQQNEYFVFVKPDKDVCLQNTDNVKIIELESGGGYPKWEQSALPKAVNLYNCDLLHCTSNTAPLHSPVPLVITLHDIIYMESLSLFKKGYTLYQRLGNMYRRIVVPRVLHKADKIITVSKFEKQRIKDFFHLPEEKLVAIYNGVGKHFRIINDKKQLAQAKEKYQLPDKYIFFLGNTDPKKNTKGVLQAYGNFVKKEGHNIKLLMLDFDNNELRKILQEIEQPELINDIHLAGYVPNSDLPAIYNLATLFLYPSLRESFGIPILEAMACGTPVVTSNTSSMPEIAQDAAFIVNPYKPNEITNAIITILNDNNLSMTLQEKGLLQAEKFSWEQMAKEVIQLYSNILTSKH